MSQVKDAQNYNGLDKGLVLLVRTRNLSPASIIINSVALLDRSIKLLGPDIALSLTEQIYGAIKTQTDLWKEKQEIYKSLLGFCLNADFITNKLPDGELEKGIWAITDFYAAQRAVSAISAGFSEKPILGSHPQDIIDFSKRLIDRLNIFTNKDNRIEPLKPDFTGNIVSIGGPCNNRFSRWIMKAEDSGEPDRPDPRLDFLDEYPNLKFIFDFDVTEESEKATWEQRRELSGTNYPIKKVDGNLVYTPEIYYSQESDDGSGVKKTRICKRDYGMIIKIRSFHKIGRDDGKWYLVIAGSHGGGTLGAAKALGEIDILREIWDKVKVKEFQAIVAVDVETEKIKIPGKIKPITLDRPTNVKLLEVEPL